MLKFWMEEFKPGYFIKYDGFRKKNKYTYITPEGTRGDYSTYEEVYKLAMNDRCVYGEKIDIFVPYPFRAIGNKFFIKKVKSGKYAGKYVCCMIEYSDGYVLIETGTSSSEESVLDIVHIKDFGDVNV